MLGSFRHHLCPGPGKLRMVGRGFESEQRGLRLAQDWGLPWAPGAAATLGGERRVGSVVHRLLPRRGSWTSPCWLLRPCEHKVVSLCKKGNEMKFLCASHRFLNVGN